MTASCIKLENLLIYRNLLNDSLVKSIQSLGTQEAACNQYATGARLIEWAEANGMTGNIPENYLLCLLGCDENVFSSIAGKAGARAGNSLAKAVAHDIVILKALLKDDLATRFGDEVKAVIDSYLPASEIQGKKPDRFRNLALLRDLFLDVSKNHTPEEVVNALSQYYNRYGCGRLAGYGAFKWDSQRRELVGIEHTDPVQLGDIVGYEYQKAELVRNTEAFMSGKPANNVLLVGARGTGKSSSVKAVVNRYFDKGLRIIEISKADFKQIPEIMTVLRQWGKKFILFIDDLSFEEYEAEYKILKSLIDGGVEVRPENVLIYATSNRRNLVKETWDDRDGSELHRQDTVNEKISLADRFGVTLFYTLPNQEEYFKIVEEIARKSSICLTSAELRSEALRWEMSHSGRSGRIAKQFIDYLAGNIAN
ncbi:ATP-binding protein [Sporomusa sp.]|uniref:ATP-binding protein n=1 Tax=Sporomusa sp. TaxID=2078658 RepID=UPI002BDDC2DB|nr:ATP-binding protein [Sporomusa sp.]HWR43981.1 ATP-binding protein [Sporomusa sp.]